MAEGEADAFLKLFCIPELVYVSMETSWKTWAVLLVCTLTGIAAASTGAYFQRNNAVKSSVICFAVSFLGSVMALGTFLVIFLGYKRKQRVAEYVLNSMKSSSSNEQMVQDNNPSTCIQIEEDAGDTNSVNRKCMNPVVLDKSMFEEDLELEDPENIFEKTDTDYDERDSEYFNSSSCTVTCSYRSCSDDGYFLYSSNESNIHEFGKDCLKFPRDCGPLIVPQMQDRGKQVVGGQDYRAGIQDFQEEQYNFKQHQIKVPIQNKMASDKFIHNQDSAKNTSKNDKMPNASWFIPNNKYTQSNHAEQPLHTDIDELDGIVKFDRQSLPSEKASTSATSTTNNIDFSITNRYNTECLQNAFNRLSTNSSINSIPNKDFIPLRSLRSKNNPNLKLTSFEMPNSSKLSESHVSITSINNEDYSQTSSKQSDCHVLPVAEEYCASDYGSYSSTSNDHIKSLSNRPNAKVYSFPPEFPSLPYPLMPEKISKQQIKKRKKYFKVLNDSYSPSYEKGPLLDMNGIPISQEFMVQVLTELLVGNLHGWSGYSNEY